LRALEPKDNAQRSLQARALQISADIETLTWCWRSNVVARSGGRPWWFLCFGSR
jgi:hypothetical protein